VIATAAVVAATSIVGAADAVVARARAHAPLAERQVAHDVAAVRLLRDVAAEVHRRAEDGDLAQVVVLDEAQLGAARPAPGSHRRSSP
jgi:hypothetical protein